MGAESGVERLHNVVVGEAVPHQDGLSGIAAGFGDGENQAVTCGEDFVSWSIKFHRSRRLFLDSGKISAGVGKITCDGELVSLQTSQVAQVGIELCGPEFSCFSGGDGIACRGIRLLPVTQGMGVEFWHGPLHQNADDEKSESQKDESRNNDCSSPYLHRKTLAVIPPSGKPEVRGI